MEVFTISYPHSPKYIYACGQITSPNYWFVKEVRHAGDDELQDLASGLQVTLINNMHGGTGALGVLVFDSRGNLHFHCKKT